MSAVPPPPVSGAPLGAVLREWRVLFATVLVGMSWCAGLQLFGGPVEGFRPALPFGAVPLVVFGAAVVVCELGRGLAGRAGRPGAERTWLLIWGFAVLGVSGAAFWGHVGGICLDPGDICLVTWPVRALLAVTAVGVLLLGGVAGAVAARWGEPPGRRPQPA